MRPILIIGAVLLVLILGKVFFFKTEGPAGPGGGAGGGKGGDKDKKPMTVEIQVATPVALNQAVYATGSVAANESVELRSEVNGRLIQLNFREGSYMQKGQLIAKLQDNDLRAQLKKLEYEENLAKQIEARQKKLLDINAISKEEYEISANKVSTLSADRELLRVQLSRTEVRAPFSGKVGLKNVSVGAYLTPATIIGTLVQTNPIKIDFSLPEKYAAQVGVGRSIDFQRDGSVSKYSARVVAIDPQIDPNLRTLTVRALTTNPSGSLLPGMSVKVNMNLANERSIMVPSQAIVPVLAGKTVFVKRNGKAMQQEVQTGYRSERDVQIVSGLSVGDSVIVSAIMSLKPDMPVKEKVK